MALVSRFNKIDIMLVCIGDHFTMGPARAAEAVKLIAPGNGNSDALRDISSADWHTGSVRSRIEAAQPKSRTAGDEGR